MSEHAQEHSKQGDAFEIAGVGGGVAELDHAAHLTEGFHTMRGSLMGLEAMEAAQAEAGGLPGASKLLAPVALVGGINNMVNGKTPLDKVQGGLETVSGGVGTLSLFGAEVGAAGPVGMVAGAGALGLSLGKLGNDTVAEHGWLGENDQGTGRNWSQWWGDKVFPTGSQFSVNNAANAGPLLLASGVGALGTAAYGLGEKIAGLYPSYPSEEASDEEMATLNQSSQGMYEAMLKGGTKRSDAEQTVGAMNGAWKANHDLDGASQSMFDAQVKAGMKPADALAIARAVNPSFEIQGTN